MRPSMQRKPAAAVAGTHQITQSLLYLDGVSVSFDGFLALNNLSLDISAPARRR
jgi:urea transport system ATP-binding protein